MEGEFSHVAEPELSGTVQDAIGDVITDNCERENSGIAGKRRKILIPAS
jgi:hypothetical protein